MTEVSSDGWSSTTSADGLTYRETDPDGRVNNTVRQLDGSYTATFSDGSSTRYDAATTQTTLVDPSGAVTMYRIDENGNEVLTSSNGDVIEYNPITNTTSFEDPDGNRQTSQRTVDGGYSITLEDGTILTLDQSGEANPNGNISVMDENGVQRIELGEGEAPAAPGVDKDSRRVEYDNDSNTLVAFDEQGAERLTLSKDGQLSVQDCGRIVDIQECAIGDNPEDLVTYDLKNWSYRWRQRNLLQIRYRGDSH